MRIFDEVQIITDKNMGMYRMALAIRFQLEALGLAVRFNQLFHWSEVERFLSAPRGAEALIICVHGIPVENQFGFRFECLKKESNGFSPTHFDITAERLKGGCFQAYPLVVSIACSSGTQAIADVLHSNGVKDYIAPAEPASMLSSITFVAQLFYYLLNYKRGTTQELLNFAVTRAATIDDTDRLGGAHLYRHFILK
jgi:hypothetical protein